ncbi:MAG: hypothetical protein PHC39_04970 [Proteiniphilum sp.]|nr:hypothetical protein [Proteiniphilum sp.]
MTDHPKQQPKRTGKCEGKNAGIYDPENVICSKLCPDRFVCVSETKNPIVGGRTTTPIRQSKTTCSDYDNPHPTHHMCLHCAEREACGEEYQNRIADDAFIDNLTGGNYS